MHTTGTTRSSSRAYDRLSTKRVLTCEMIGGEDYATFCERATPGGAQRGERDDLALHVPLALPARRGSTPTRIPGNYRFLGGGRVAFLDFGCVKKLPPHLVAGTKRYITTAMDQDWAEFEQACVEVLGYDPSDNEAFELSSTYTKLMLEPLTTDGTFRHTHEVAREAVAFLVRGGKKIMKPKEGELLPNLPKPIHMPQDHTFMNRLQWGLASVMAGSAAKATSGGSPSRGYAGPHTATRVERERRRDLRHARRRDGRRASATNLLVHGDNLVALRGSPRGSPGKIRCVVPRSAVQHGSDVRRIRRRARARRMGRDDAAAARGARAAPRRRRRGVRRDRRHAARARSSLLMDEVFGAKNRISTITVVRSATTGHKAINAGPVHVSDFLLAYAKDKKKWRYRPQVRVREGFDPAYSARGSTTRMRARDAGRSARSSAAVAERARVMRRRATATRALGREGVRSRSVARASRSRARVTSCASRSRATRRSAAPRRRSSIDRARAPSRVFVLEREGRSPFIVRGGNRILFLARQGSRWSTGALRSSSRSRTSGTTFRSRASRAKAASSSRGTRSPSASSRASSRWRPIPATGCIDPFLGSGTTAAVAHKMGRRWIGIESGDHLTTLAEPRLASRRRRRGPDRHHVGRRLRGRRRLRCRDAV